MDSDNTATNTASPEQRYLELAREAFNGSTTWFDASVRRQAEAGLRQFQGVHPAGSKYHSETYKGRARFFRPKTRTAIRKGEAAAAEAYFTTNDVISCEAEDDGNPAHQATADVMKQLLNYRLKKSIPWFQILLGGYQEAMSVGTPIAHVYWKYDAKRKIDKPCIDLVPLENFRIDPGADWTDPVNTSPYNILMIPMYVKDVKARMTNQDDKTGLPTWISCDTSVLLKAQTTFADSIRSTRERGRTDSKDQQTTLREFSIVWVHMNIVDIDGEDMLYYTLGTEHMLSKPVPLEKEYFHGRRPFVMGTCVLEAHKLYTEGLTGLTRDTQGEINEVANQRIDNVKFAMNKRYFGKRGAQIDVRSLMRNVVGSITMMNDPENDVKVIDTPDVTASAYEEQDRLNGDFDDVAGAFSPSSIASNRKLGETVGGLNLLSTNTNQMGSYQLRTYNETFVEPVLSQLALLERFYETDDVILAMAGRKAGLVAELLNPDAMDKLLLNDINLSISVGIGATSPQEQINNFLTGIRALREVLADGTLERYGLKVEEVIAEVFGKLGHKDGKRFFDLENEDPALTNAKATIAQLQQALAAKHDPALIEAQVRKLDGEVRVLQAKVTDTNATAQEKTGRMIFASAQTAQTLAAVPGLAPLIDSILKLVGYTEPPGAQLEGAVPAEALAGISQEEIKDPRTGVKYNPAGGGATPGVANVGNGPDAGAAAGDTTPMTPAGPKMPASPGTGAEKGIQTAEADS